MAYRELPESTNEETFSPGKSVLHYLEKAFNITCMLCGYSGKPLTPHLKSKHQTTPKEYRKQFAMPARTPLVSKAYRAKRIKIAKESGIGEKLKQARKTKRLRLEGQSEIMGPTRLVWPAQTLINVT